MNRRGFLTGIIAAAAAPAIIRTPGLIMPIKPALVLPPREIWDATIKQWGTGITITDLEDLAAVRNSGWLSGPATVRVGNSRVWVRHDPGGA